MTDSMALGRKSGGLSEVIGIAFPLIVSSSTHAAKLFCDRVMLAWYAERSIAAALSAGMTSFMFIGFFMGVAGYANAFVAQYHGAGNHGRIGRAVWQAVLFALAAGALLALLGDAFSPFFLLVGHSAEFAKEEEAYFRVLMAAAVFSLLTAALGCFWTGRNKTWTVVGVNVVSIVFNIVFNWALIFGAAGIPHLDGAPSLIRAAGDGLNALSSRLGAPAMGIFGAGLATVGTEFLSALAFLALFVRKPHRRAFGTWPRRVFEYDLFRRLMRFGSGSGMQLFLDVGSFSVFNLLMGKYAQTAGGGNIAAAAGVAISVNAVSFIPMIGLGMAASIMVGHGVGAKNIPYAVRAVRNCRKVIMLYTAATTVVFVLFPGGLVAMFSPRGGLNRDTVEMAVDFLRFVAMFCFSDGFFILYNNAIRGAGDTKFSMWVMGVLGWGAFAVPCAAAFALGAGPRTLWSILVLYTFLASGIFYWRYRQGKWRLMRVIEDAAADRAKSSVRQYIQP